MEAPEPGRRVVDEVAEQGVEEYLSDPDDEDQHGDDTDERLGLRPLVLGEERLRRVVRDEVGGQLVVERRLSEVAEGVADPLDQEGAGPGAVRCG